MKTIFFYLLINLAIILVIKSPTQTNEFIIHDCNFDLLKSAINQTNQERKTVLITCNGVINFSEPLLIKNNVNVLSYNNVVFEANNQTYFFDILPSRSLYLYGITMQNGFSNENGGAIKGNTSGITLENCTVQNNSADLGAVIYAESGSIRLLNSTFSSNSATTTGSVIYHQNAFLTISNSTFTDNHGSVIWGQNSTLTTIANSTFSNNTRAVTHRLGELIISNSTFNNHISSVIYNGEQSEATISGSTFRDNQSDDNGGAIHSFEVDHLTLYDNSFENNFAPNMGGAIYFTSPNPYRQSVLTLLNNQFIDNHAQVSGGAIVNQWANMTSENDLFHGNSSEQSGGAILNKLSDLYIEHSTFTDNTSRYGSAISIYSDALLNINQSLFYANQSQTGTITTLTSNDAPLLITNSMFINNFASYFGGAIVNSGNTIVQHSTFVNNIAELQGSTFANIGGSLLVENSIIWGASDVIHCSELWEMMDTNIQNTNLANVPCGRAQIRDDLLLDISNPPNIRLLSNSPAIDAYPAPCAVDIDQIGTLRPQGDGCDIGAIEYHP